MKLRQVRIGVRLGIGFGALILGAAALLALALVSQRRSSDELAQSLDRASQRETETTSMKSALLESAIAVRNMGLESELAAVQKHQAVAESRRKAFVAGIESLKVHAWNDAEKEAAAALAGIDAKMNAAFMEAVGLYAAFGTEQASKIITTQIDPLLDQAKAQVERVVEIQRRQGLDARERAQAQARETAILVVLLGGAVLAAAAVLAWRIAASVTGPLQGALRTTREVAAGNLRVEIDATGRDEAAQLMAGLCRMRDSLAAVVSDVRCGADSIATASSEIAQGNADLSARTETQASALQQTAATMDELGATVRHNTANAQQANRLAQDASQIAVRGGTAVGQVVETMKEISESSRRIGEIIGVIDGIAFQTNILALNAAVEAARAGEQGRGFAVVASEVRSLAQRSADAARQVKELVSTSVGRVEQGTAQVDRAGQTMTEIVGAIVRVSEIVAQISAASQEQSTGVSQVGDAVAQIDQTTQQNSALVEESAAAAESLRHQSQQLVQAMAVFTLPARERA